MTESGPKYADREGSGPRSPRESHPAVYEMDAAAVRRLDRAAIETFHIPSLVLMENAALGVLPRALRMLEGTGRSVSVVCGPGNNGGDGLALARHLHIRGCRVAVGLLGDAGELRGDAATNARIVEATASESDSITIGPWRALTETTPDLVVDALFGIGLSRAPEGGAADAIAWIGRRRAGGSRVLSIDVPSGLDADTGSPVGSACVRADATVTLSAVKPGLRRLDAQAFVGELSVAGIGVPESLLARFGRALNRPAGSEPGDRDRPTPL